MLDGLGRGALGPKGGPVPPDGALGAPGDPGELHGAPLCHWGLSRTPWALGPIGPLVPIAGLRTRPRSAEGAHFFTLLISLLPSLEFVDGIPDSSLELAHCVRVA